LSVPKTVDEYYSVLKAFKTQDPNKNGKPDEIPYFNRSKQGAYDLFTLFGITTLEYEKDGKYQFDRYSEKLKDAVKNVAKWYQEGLIDPEIFTRGGNARDVLLGDNIGGSTHDWFASTALYNDKFKEKLPGLKIMPMVPPADINGRIWEESAGLWSARDGLINVKIGIRLKLYNILILVYSEEGRRLANFGLEGDTYTMGTASCIHREVLTGDKPVNDLLWV
jgi:putative aldouronate transport system substrate-binding protein